MRKKLFLIPGLLAALALAVAAQTKASGTISCRGKSNPSYSIEVGDKPTHSLSLDRTACTWTKPMEIGGLQAKDAYDVSFGDATGDKSHSSGYHVSNMANGDKLFLHFQGIDDNKAGTSVGTLTLTGGTGRLKGLKGKGSYKGKADAAGDTVFEVDCEYELPAAKSDKMK